MLLLLLAKFPPKVPATSPTGNNPAADRKAEGVPTVAESVMQVFDTGDPVRIDHPLVAGADRIARPGVGEAGRRRRSAKCGGVGAQENVGTKALPGAAAGGVDHARSPGVAEAAANGR